MISLFGTTDVLRLVTTSTADLDISGGYVTDESPVVYGAIRAKINSATTTGSRWSINGPTTSYLSLQSSYSLTTTSLTFNSVNSYDLPAASNASSAATTGNLAYMTGIITPSANGNVIARFASEILSSAITAKAGALLKWTRIL